jgi:hypothetical protein
LPTSKDLPSSLVQLRTAVWTGVTRDTMPGADISTAAKAKSLVEVLQKKDRLRGSSLRNPNQAF